MIAKNRLVNNTLHGVLWLALGIVCAQCTRPTEPTITEINEINSKHLEYSSFKNGYNRAQTAYIMYGAMTDKEKVRRLGQYYNIHWADACPDKPMVFTFDYMQAGTGSKVMTKSFDYPAGRSGDDVVVEIPVNGDDFLKNGRIMAWKASLAERGKPPLSVRTSYLWRESKPESQRKSQSVEMKKEPVGDSKDAKLVNLP